MTALSTYEPDQTKDNPYLTAVWKREATLSIFESLLYDVIVLVFFMLFYNVHEHRQLFRSFGVLNIVDLNPLMFLF